MFWGLPSPVFEVQKIPYIKLCSVAEIAEAVVLVDVISAAFCPLPKLSCVHVHILFYVGQQNFTRSSATAEKNSASALHVYLGCMAN